MFSPWVVESSKHIITDVASEVMYERTTAVFKAYFQARTMQEQNPARKAHHEELVFVLTELLKLDLFVGALKAQNMKGECHHYTIFHLFRGSFLSVFVSFFLSSACGCRARQGHNGKGQERPPVHLLPLGGKAALLRGQGDCQGVTAVPGSRW